MRKWLNDMLADPDGSPSSTRITGAWLVLVGTGIAIAGFVMNRPEVEIVATLLGGGALNFMSRKKSDGTAQ